MRRGVEFTTAKLDVIEGRRPVIAYTRDWPASFEMSPHFHDRCQLVYGSKGIMNVMIPSSTWVVPPQRAVWIPAGVPHVIRTGTAVSLRTLYVDPTADRGLPTECRVLSVSPLLRELLLKAMELPAYYPLGGREERVMSLLIDEILQVASGLGDLHLPEPKDPRVRAVVEAILEDPADDRTREQWAAVVGASSRTIDRIFTEETGMSFGRWKRQAVLLESMRRLAAGESVTNVALDLGYDSPSAFIAMFRRTLGVTPSKLFR